jgi:hypothetical protein
MSHDHGMSTNTPPRRFWTDAEMALLRTLYADTPTADLAVTLDCSVRRVLQKANSMGLRKSVELIATIARQRTTQLNHGARKTAFKPGSVPWNKGTHYTAGGRSAETRFGKGNKPHTWVPVGTYRIVPDGVLEQKVNEEPGPNHVRWFPVHRMVWEAAHGPVPSGHAVVFRPGQKTNVLELITVDRLECISRQQLMQRNSVHTRLPPELANAVQLLGALKRRIRETAEKEAQP